MPTVRGLIQDIQHNGLLHQGNLSVLRNCTIGIDAVSFFESLYAPSTTFEVLGLVDHVGLEQTIVKQLRSFQQHQITPIFVFPGISPNDRTHTLNQQELQLQDAFEKQEQIQLLQQLSISDTSTTATSTQANTTASTHEQPAVVGGKKNKKNAPISAASFGDESSTNDQTPDDFTSMYRPITNKKNKRVNKFAFDNEPTSQPQAPSKSTSFQASTQPRSTSATSTSSSPLDDVQWSFDEQSLSKRQRGWDLLMNEKNKNVVSSQASFQDMSTSFNFQYRKALLQILHQYSMQTQSRTTLNEDIVLKLVVLHAPYSVSAQLAWLQRSPHRFVHAVLGHSDILLFGVDKYIQTINFDAASFNYVALQEVLVHYGLSLTQLISVSLLSGYSYALTHPLALNDPKFTSSFSFSHALNNFRIHGKGSLQTLLEWWVQQPPGPTIQQHHNSALSPIGGSRKDIIATASLTLDEQINMVVNINKVMQQLQGSAVITLGGELALLRSTTCQLIDIPNLTAVGRVAHKLFKQQVLQEKQAAIQSGGPILKGKVLQQNISPVQVKPDEVAAELLHIPPQEIISQNAMIRPHVPLPQPIVQLLSTSAIQPSSISSLFTGHILDVTVHNPSTELDKILDWANLALRGPAIWSILYSLNTNATSKPNLVDPAFKSLYSQLKPAQGTNNHHATPFILNSRFNDRRKNLYPRDIMTYCRTGGSDNDNTYGIDQIQKFEQVDNIFGQAQLNGFLSLLDKMAWDPAQINPISHYLTLLPALWKIQPHSDPAMSATASKKQKKKTATTQANLEDASPTQANPDNTSTPGTPLTSNEKLIGLTMLYILYFVGLITPQGTFTRMGFAINQFLITIESTSPESFAYMNKNHQLYDTLLFLYVLVTSDVLNTKTFSIESSELNNSAVTVSGKGETSQQHVFQRILYRVVALLSVELQTNTSNVNQTLIAELLTKKDEIPSVPEVQPKPTKGNNKGGYAKRSTHDNKVAQQLLSVLHREIVCYSALINSLTSTFHYAFDLVLSAITLYGIFDTSKENAIVFSKLTAPIPLQSYQASPLLSCLFRQSVLTKASIKKGQAAPLTASQIVGVEQVTLPASMKTIIVGFWDALNKGTGGFGITTQDAQSALDLVA